MNILINISILFLSLFVWFIISYFNFYILSKVKVIDENNSNFADFIIVVVIAPITLILILAAMTTDKLISLFTKKKVK